MVTKRSEKWVKISFFFQMSAIFKFDFQKKKIIAFSRRKLSKIHTHTHPHTHTHTHTPTHTPQQDTHTPHPHTPPHIHTHIPTQISNFTCDNYIFTKTIGNKNKQWTHYSVLKLLLTLT